MTFFAHANVDLQYETIDNGPSIHQCYLVQVAALVSNASPSNNYVSYV